MGGPEGLGLNKQRRERETKLMDEIKEPDQRYSGLPSPDLLKRKLYLQAEQNLI